MNIALISMDYKLKTISSQSDRAHAYSSDYFEFNVCLQFLIIPDSNKALRQKAILNNQKLMSLEMSQSNSSSFYSSFVLFEFQAKGVEKAAPKLFQLKTCKFNCQYLVSYSGYL
jgi:hypothetical protein